jgi:hypothetical protein
VICRLQTWLLVASLACTAGCGYVGGPLPPALNIPVAITDLNAAQKAGRIVVRFTPSLQSTDGLVLSKLSEIELRAGGNSEPGPFNIDRWASGAQRIDAGPPKAELTTIEVPVAGFEGRDVIIAVRALGPNGRPGGWSSPVILHVSAPPVAPRGVTAEATAEGVLLRWEQGGEGSFRVYRKADSEKQEALAGASNEAKYLDADAAFGTTYTYRVQRVVAAGGSDAESPMSDEVGIKPVDTFAPAVPAGLMGQVGVGAIELAWDRNLEADLAGYQVWRATGDAPLQKLGDRVATASFSDKTAEAGKTYRYAVSSVDAKGNESKPCAAVTVANQ